MTPLPERALFAGLALVAIHFPLVPFGYGAERAPMPDLLFCLVAAWVVRRPRDVALPVVLGLGLFADLLLARAPGLGALGLLLAAEAMRSRRPVNPLAEWLTAGALFGAVLAGTTALLALTFAPLPTIRDLAGHWLATAIAFPFVALIAQLALRQRPKALR